MPDMSLVLQKSTAAAATDKIFRIDGDYVPASEIARIRTVQTVTSSSTVTPNTTDDLVVISAQAANLTIANPAGTAADGQGFVIRLKDNGTSRTITFGANYQAMGATLPVSTTISKWLYIPVVYNATDSKWDVLPATEQA